MEWMFWLVAGAVGLYLTSKAGGQAKSAQGGAGSSGEPSFWDVATPKDSTVQLRIGYEDAYGRKTDRNIDVRLFGSDSYGEALISAFCHLRGEPRTFRVDRVAWAIDRETGEMIESLPEWLEEKWQETPDFALEELTRTAWDAVRVMFYVSKADGRLTKEERGLLRGSLKTLANRDDLDDKKIDKLINSLNIPSFQAFKQACGRLAKRDDGLGGRVLEWCQQIAAADNKITNAEREALEYLRKRIDQA